jgi:hypothetical protein
LAKAGVGGYFFPLITAKKHQLFRLLKSSKIPYLYDESWISMDFLQRELLFPAAVSPGGLQTLRLCSTTTTTPRPGDPEPTTTGAVVEGDPHIHTFEGETLGMASLGVGKKWKGIF